KTADNPNIFIPSHLPQSNPHLNGFPISPSNKPMPLGRVILLLLTFATSAQADSFFQDQCVKCHGPDKQKGDLRLDTLAPDLEIGTSSSKS
ncbi:MAG: hypothetical protein ACJAQT_003658, partial [Akkermansiaceae bacterium]